MPGELIDKVFSNFGVPAGFMFVGILAFYLRLIVTRAELNALNEQWKRTYDNMVIEKDKQISDAKEGESEMWKIVRPTIQVAHAVIDSKRRESR